MSPPLCILQAQAVRSLSRCNASVRTARSATNAFVPRSAAPTRIAQLTRPTFTNSTRLFSTTSALSKKKEKKSSASSSSSSSSSSSPSTSTCDPFDFSELTRGINTSIERLKEDISRLRSAGGRFNPEIIENVKVELKNKNGGKGGKGMETVRLGDLAQVIPKGGRQLTILVGEEDYLKPITSAILSASTSGMSFNPQPDSHNPLQLNLPIPPPTRESRDQSLKDAKAAMEKAANAVKNARQSLNKKLKAMGTKKIVRPDDLKKALEQMEKMTEKGQKDVKDVFEGARKALEQG